MVAWGEEKLLEGRGVGWAVCMLVGIESSYGVSKWWVSSFNKAIATAMAGGRRVFVHS